MEDREFKEGKEGTFTDERNGKTYKTLEINGQTWLAENLNYKVEGSWCYGDDESLADKHGRLYDWKGAVEACPPGWRLPSIEEKEFLWDTFGSNYYAFDFCTDIFGGFFVRCVKDN